MFKHINRVPFTALSDTSKSILQLSRCYSQQHKHIKVTVLGAAGGIGQPLSLLLKQLPVISRLSLFDIQNVSGVVSDLSHIETRARVESHLGEANLEAALRGADIVMIPAGVPRKPGMTRDDLFKTNSQIVFGLLRGVAKFCPNTLLCVITNPVNSIVPVAAEVLKHYGVYDPRRLFGVTTLDVVRANTFVSETRGLDVTRVNVPVMGGHSADTIIPVYSQMTPTLSLTTEERYEFTKRMRDAGTEVVEAKAGTGGATLAMAYASWRFAKSLLQAIGGKEGVVECAYVKAEGVDAEYFATPLLLGKNGIEKNLGVGNLNEYELDLLQRALPELKANIKKGEDFAREMLSASTAKAAAANS